eukprot:TRINITY_DN19466_c0_g1_i1.p1 TRINITY_DN19466_c0_g1~~TRINITY_DN19466_c0_g1_i1.p1  ORF type:complete len:338 (+),score=83.33 TRINITY_DN19466_c0_g1_i1:39-1052(+)
MGASKGGLATLCFLSLCTLSLCWWETGHLLVAKVAELDLLARGRDDVLSLATEFALYGSNLSPNYSNTFAGSALWADDIKEQGIHMWDNWHFIDQPFIEDGTFIKLDLDPNNVVNMINEAVKVLSPASAQLNKTLEKAFLTRFLIHCVGDLHQPLHTVSLYNEDFPNGDEGGNLVNVTLGFESDENITNLHAFWDSGAALFPSIRERPVSNESMEVVADLAEDLIDRFTRDDFADQLSVRNVAQWARDSFALSRDDVYPPVLEDGPTITREYQQKSYEIIVRQVTLAGYRLADLFESIFSSKSQIKNKYFAKFADSRYKPFSIEERVKESRRKMLIL